MVTSIRDGYVTVWYVMTCIGRFLCTSQIEASTSPPLSNPPGIWTFEDWIVQIPSPRGKKAVQMPHQLVLKYLSSKKFRLQSNTVHAFQREICCNNTFRESYSLQRRNSILEIRQTLQNRKNSLAYLYARTRDKSGSNSPPFQGNVQIPPSPGTMPGLCPRGMLKLQFDRYIISYIYLWRVTAVTADPWRIAVEFAWCFLYSWWFLYYGFWVIFLRSVTTYYGSVTVCYWISSDFSYIRDDFRVLFLILFDDFATGPWPPC